MSLGMNLDNAGWRQGSIVKIEDCQALEMEIPEGGRLIVISQSCDITHAHIAEEPCVEVITATLIDKQEGNFTHNKNPRKLHLILQTGDGEKCLQLLQLDKNRLQRTVLENLSPDTSVYFENREKNVMARWLAARYQRPAFPNGFNSAIGGVRRAKKRKERQAAKRISPIVSGIFLQVLPFRDLRDGETYKVNMLALVPASKKKEVDLESSDVRQPIQEIAFVMKEANMEVELNIEFEDMVPYSYFRDDFKPWSYDEISLANEPPDETP